MKDFTNHFGCFYLGYFVENIEKNIRIGFTSNTDWQNEYIGNNLIENCHLWKTVINQFLAQEKNHLILPWETVSPSTKLEKDISLYRSEMHIGYNGVSFCSKNKNLREFFAIAPEKNTKNFITNVAKNHSLIRQHVDVFRKFTQYKIFN